MKFSLLCFFLWVGLPAAEIAEGYAVAPGAHLWFQDTQGKGTPVVLLHAASGNAAMWESQMRSFSQAGYRVIAWDRRGHGKTTTEPDVSASTAVEDMARILETLNVRRFHLVGTAAGGIVALDFALSFQERVISLTVANSVYGIEDPSYLEIRSNLRAASAQASGMRTDFLELGPSYRAMNPEGVTRWLSGTKQNPPVRIPQPTRNKITFAAIQSLRIPVLLLTGDGDLLSPPPLIRLVHSKIPQSEMLVVPESGHSAFWEQPEMFNRTVLSFIARHSPR